MRAVVQRVSEARVEVEGRVTGAIGVGLLVLLGVAKGDSEDDAAYLADKVRNLRVFEDDAGKMNRSLSDVNGSLLIISQFTLLADTRRGHRPSFDAAAPPEIARTLYESFVNRCRQAGAQTQTGIFQAEMRVYLVNMGPVTLVVESKKNLQQAY